MKKIIFFSSLFVILSVTAFISIKYYSYVFAKTVKGEVLRVERVVTADVIASRGTPASQLFSFAVSIRSKDGEIHTASTEDRQWAVVTSGQCAEAKYFPYPFWEFEKANTYFGARLERLYDCEKDN